MESSSLFHHIYLEERVLKLPQTQQILAKFPTARRVYIKRYQDLFHRKHQDFLAQKQTPALFLAYKEPPFLYPGAPVCQNFGNQHFYYTSCLMNCMFDCEYCYLQGMYPSGNPVIFVNPEDIFEETRRLLRLHPVYLCISYDSDLLAMEGILSYCERFLLFAAEEPELTIELRTKCGLNQNLTRLLSVAKNLPEEVSNSLKERFIFAFTLSPDASQKQYEHHTGTLKARLAAAAAAANAGFAVRLCLDPLLNIPDFSTQYQQLANTIRSCLSAEQIKDISLGAFRVSGEYLKRMRRQRPDSPLLQYPYQKNQGVYSYDPITERKLLEIVSQSFEGFLPRSKFYFWGQQETSNSIEAKLN